MEEKLEKNRKKLFDRLRKLNRTTSEDELKKLEDMIRQKPGSSELCLTGLEITMDRLMKIYNEISDQTNCPVKYTKIKIKKYQK
jgi:hypothetical protein